MSGNDRQSYWKNPITVVIFIILLTTILLIAANVFDYDKGNVLKNLSNIDYARGLITYLFAVGTIGVIIAVIMSILLQSKDANERFSRSKDILTLLIGIFGTIVGFYFGSELSQKTEIKIPLEISTTIEPEEFQKGKPITIKASIKGKYPPYSYRIYYEPNKMVKGTTKKKLNQEIIIDSEKQISTALIYIKDRKGNDEVVELRIPSAVQ